MPSYSKVEDIQPLSTEEFKLYFKGVTGRDYVEGGQNNCEVLFLSCHLVDLQYWAYIVKRPALARTVRLVVIDDATLLACLVDPSRRELRQLAGPHVRTNCILEATADNPSWRADWNRQQEWSRREDLGPAQRQEMFDNQCEWLMNQAEAHFEIRENMLDKELFLQTLKANRLPNFTKLVVTHLPVEREIYGQPDPPYTPPSRSPSVQMWEAKFPEGPLPLSGVRPRVSWNWPDRDASAPLAKLESNFPREGTRCFHLAPICAPFRGLSICLDVLNETRKWVSEFSIVPGQDFPAGLFNSPGIADFPISFFIMPAFRPHVSKLANIIERLSVLRLSISCKDIQEGERWDALVHLISKAKKLKVLHLKLEELNDFHKYEVLDAITSSSLEEIHLDGVEFSPRAFLFFLFKQRSTLKKLSMNGCYCGGPSWQRLLEEARIRRGVLQVEELYINNAIPKDPNDFGYELNKFLELPEVPRHLIIRDGLARWRRWMAEPTPENFPLE